MKKRFIAIIIAITLIIIPFFVNAFIELESDYWKMISEHKDAWISYYGSVIGGSLTLVGVWWTINYNQQEQEKIRIEQEQQKKEDFRLQHLPFLTVDLCEPDPSYSNVVPKMFKMYVSFITKEDDDTISIPNKIFFLELKNVGYGIAEKINFEFKQIVFTNDVTNKTISEYDINVSSLFDDSYIINNNQVIIPVLFKYSASNKNKYGNLSKPFLGTDLKADGAITYYDSTGNKYSQNLKLHFKLKFSSNPYIFTAEAIYIYLENRVRYPNLINYNE